jgi:hypothetical protein
MKKLMIAILALTLLGYACNKEDDGINQPTKYDITYKATMYSTVLSEYNYFSCSYRTDRNKWITDTIWVTKMVQHWERKINKPYDLFEPSVEHLTRNCVLGYDSVRLTIILADSVYYTKKI